MQYLNGKRFNQKFCLPYSAVQISIRGISKKQKRVNTYIKTVTFNVCAEYRVMAKLLEPWLLSRNIRYPTALQTSYKVTTHQNDNVESLLWRPCAPQLVPFAWFRPLPGGFWSRCQPRSPAASLCRLCRLKSQSTETIAFHKDVKHDHIL